MVGVQADIHWGDILVLVAYLLISLAVGAWTMYKSNRNSVSGFFLASRSMVWWPIGMSLFASNIGPNNFVGQAGTASSSGYSVIMFEWNAVFLLILLGWIFIPVYISSGIYTMPEYLSRRFGGRRLRVYLTIIALITYLLVTLPGDLYAGALFLQQTMGLSIYWGVALMIAIATLFTVIGGLTTVILTDAVAVIIMVIGGIILLIMGMVAVGGWESMQYGFERAVASEVYLKPNTTCGRPRSDAFHIFRGFDADYPGFGTFMRTVLGSLWYWCANQNLEKLPTVMPGRDLMSYIIQAKYAGTTSQINAAGKSNILCNPTPVSACCLDCLIIVLVQRALSAKNISHAKAGCILAGYLKLSPFLIIVLPGMISRALFPDEIGCVDPAVCSQICENSASCTNIAYPKLVAELMPPGLKGLMLATMMAAGISSLTSIFNSASTLVAIDIWPIIRPKARDKEILIVSKLFLIVIVALGVAWIPIMQSSQGGELFKYTSAATGYLGGPTCAMFVIAVFSSKATENGAFWSMVLSQLFGIIRFILEIVFPAPVCGEEETRPSMIANLHAYDFTVIQICLAFVLCFVISIVTKPPPKACYVGLTYWTRFDTTYAAERDELSRQKMLDIIKARQVSQTKKQAKLDAKNASKNESQPNESLTDEKRSKTSSQSDEMCTEEDQPEASSQGSAILESNFIPEFETQAQRLKFLEESRTAKIITNLNGVLVCAITVFLYGFFG